MPEVPSEAKEAPKESHSGRDAIVIFLMVVFVLAILASVSVPPSEKFDRDHSSVRLINAVIRSVCCTDQEL